jgi:hypothetical protein
MTKRPARDDLFAIFPDLPWLHPDRLVAAQIEAVQNRAQREVRQTPVRPGKALSSRRRQGRKAERLKGRKA